MVKCDLNQMQAIKGRKLFSYICMSTFLFFTSVHMQF